MREYDPNNPMTKAELLKEVTKLKIRLANLRDKILRDLGRTA
jgi:ribosomal protein L29